MTNSSVTSVAKNQLRARCNYLAEMRDSHSSKITVKFAYCSQTTLNHHLPTWPDIVVYKMLSFESAERRRKCENQLMSAMSARIPECVYNDTQRNSRGLFPSFIYLIFSHVPFSF